MSERTNAVVVVVCADDNVAQAALARFVLELRTDVEIRRKADPSLPRGVAQLAVQGEERWMCVMQQADDVETARWALTNGAWCIASLEDGVERFEQALTALLVGSPHHLPVSFARLLARGSAETGTAEPARPEMGQHIPLTNREREVLQCVAEGLTNSEIADRLSISVHTVRTHLSSMATKMDATNRFRLVAKATELGYRETRAGNGE